MKSPDSTPASTPYPVRLSEEQRKRIKVVADRVELSFPDTMRKAIDLGLPVLEQRLTDSHSVTVTQNTQ